MKNFVIALIVSMLCCGATSAQTLKKATETKCEKTECVKKDCKKSDCTQECKKQCEKADCKQECKKSEAKKECKKNCKECPNKCEKGKKMLANPKEGKLLRRDTLHANPRAQARRLVNNRDSGRMRLQPMDTSVFKSKGNRQFKGKMRRDSSNLQNGRPMRMKKATKN